MSEITSQDGRRYDRWLPNRWDLLGLWYVREIETTRLLSLAEMTCWFSVREIS